MRTRLYSIKPIKDRPTLSLDLTLNIVEETNYRLKIKIQDEIITINKFDYLNKFLIFDNGKGIAFYVCNKNVDPDFVFKKLLKYADSLLDNRINELTEKRELINQELNKPQLQRVAA